MININILFMPATAEKPKNHTFWVAHTYVANIKESPPGGGVRQSLQWSEIAHNPSEPRVFWVC